MFRDVSRVHAAGGVVMSFIKGRMHVALVAQPVAMREKGSVRWTFPKGIVGPTESDQEAAVRKVQQELGIQASIVTVVDEICYVVENTFKTVQHYWMEWTAGELNTGEYRAEWVPVSQAHKWLKFPEERYVLRLATQMVHLASRQGSSKPMDARVSSQSSCTD